MHWQQGSDIKSKWNQLSSSADCRIQPQDVWTRISSKLNVHLQTDWAIADQAKNLNSILAHPYDQWAFSPLNLTADMAWIITLMKLWKLLNNKLKSNMFLNRSSSVIKHRSRSIPSELLTPVTTGIRFWMSNLSHISPKVSSLRKNHNYSHLKWRNWRFHNSNDSNITNEREDIYKYGLFLMYWDVCNPVCITTSH